MSGAVKSVGKAVGGAVKSVGKAVGGAVKSVGKAVSSVANVVKKVAPIAAPLAMVAFPGIGTALGGMLGAGSGTAATLLGGGLIGAGASAIGGKNPLTGGLLGAGGAYLGSQFGGASGLMGGGGGVAFPGAQYSVAPGSFQAALPGLGVQTAASAAPFTAIPGSFQAALPGLLSGGGSAFTASNVLRGLNLANSLLGGQPQQITPSVQYQPQQPLAGQANFEPTISLLTNYGVV
jgi:hypothetical protein